MLLRTALEQIPGIDAAEIPDVAVHGIAYDSRKVQKGDLFVAIKGERTDGVLFIRQAVDRGAAAVASESPADTGEHAVSFTVPDSRKFLADFSRIFYGDPASTLQLAAITGTNGKTTTAYLLDSIFRQAGLRACLAGTIEMKTVSSRFESLHTTPEASDLLHFLRLAVDEGCTHGALEISSHSLALQRVANLKFKVGIFMNLTADHLDFHKTMKDYFEAKQLLFMPGNGNKIEAAVINTDDPYGMQLTEIFEGPIIRFGMHRDAEIHVIENEILPEGTKLHVHTPAGEVVFQTRLIGRHNAYNIMAATGASLCMNIDLKKIKKGIESLETVPGRFERVDEGQDFTVIVDYAHSPDALENLLTLAAELPHNRIITVFGCGGDRDKNKCPVMGSISVRKSHVSIVTSDNPRSEDPLRIIDDIEAGMRESGGNYQIVPDRREAIEMAVASAGKEDIVVIAGKGHEDYQIIGASRNPFDDQLVAQEMIRKHAKDRS